MTNQELELRFTSLVKEERRITHEILELILEVEKRRLHLERGYSNLYDWLVHGHGYSQSAAHRRIAAARLLKAVPEIKEKLSSGEVNLTTLAQAQGAFRREEMRSGLRMTVEKKCEIVKQIEGKSAQETERVLVSFFPEENAARESLRPINETESKLHLILEKEAIEALERAKELLSHVMPGASWSQIVAHLAKDFVNRKDPVQKNSVAVNPCVKKKAEGKCEYRDPTTSKQCGSRYQIELDHVRPKAMGGDDKPENLRVLCRAHNFYEAEKQLGRTFMNQWRKFQ